MCDLEQRKGWHVVVQEQQQQRLKAPVSTKRERWFSVPLPPPLNAFVSFFDM
jgi:hypothetical protein